MCLIVQVFSFFIANIKKIGTWFFTIFSLPDTHTGSLSGHKTKYKTNVLTFMLWLITAGESCCAQVFFKELSQLLSTFGLLWTIFFWSRWLALSLSLSLCLSVCLSVCLSISLSLTHSLKLCHSLSLSLPHFPLVLSSRIDICLHVLKSTCQNCYSRTVKQLQAHHGRELEVVVVVGLPYCHVVHVHSTIYKACEETAGFYPRRAAKIFSRSRHSSRKKRLTTWSLKTLHKNAIPKKTFTMNYRGQSKRHPICRGKLLSAHQGGAGRRCYGATWLTWNRSIAGWSSRNEIGTIDHFTYYCLGSQGGKLWVAMRLLGPIPCRKVCRNTAETRKTISLSFWIVGF